MKGGREGRKGRKGWREGGKEGGSEGGWVSITTSLFHFCVRRHGVMCFLFMDEKESVVRSAELSKRREKSKSERE